MEKLVKLYLERTNSNGKITCVEPNIEMLNKGKKKSRFNSKWSDAEMRAKLTELGFLGEATSTEEKISTTNKGNTVEQLETLTKLYESGNLTKEEFDAAKKKILND